MKKWTIFFIGFILTIGLSFSQSIIITKPDQNSDWEIGQSYFITWTKTGPMEDTVRIDLYKGLNTFVTAISPSTPNDGSFHWQVPQSITPNSYHIRIRTLNGRVSAVSAVFKISAPVINRPDLMVVDAFVKPKPRRVNETITFSTKVQNIGNRKAAPCKGEVKITGPQGFQTRTYHILIPELDPNEWSLLPEFYKLPLPGVYKNTITVDINDDIYETYEHNNEKVKLYTVDPAPLPDLIACIRNGGCIELNTTKKVWASVRNIGDAPSSPCKLRFYIKENDVKIFDVPSLGPGKNKVFYREPIWHTKGSKSMKAIVDYYGVVDEKKENNNSVEGYIMVFIPMLEGCTAGIAGKKCSDSK
ncbi:MAG: hypothetical protein AMJ89_01485 [candidate division Zixibacteria bacterium SM23_73]|nr:MAG: hypothetical protein AMJ89_01485 [candidate division Zixibacteria bacterium SM23_73]